MKRYVYFAVFLMFIIIFSGCIGKKAAEKPKTYTENDTDITVVSRDLSLSVGSFPKYFKENMIKAPEGYISAAIKVTVKNNTREKLHIAPRYVNIISTGNNTYQPSVEKTNIILGKGAFKELDIPYDYRGGGLLLYEIKKGEEIDKVIYKDEKGHELTVDLPNKGKDI